MNPILLSFILLNGEFPICTVSAYQERPSVAFDGENYLVVWQDERSGVFDIWGQFVSQDGELIDTNFPICVEEGWWYNACVSFGAGTYLVTWDGGIDSSVVYGQLILPSGVFVDTMFSISNRKNSLEPDVAFDGTNFMVVWRDIHVGDDQVCGRVVSPAGTFVDTVFTVPVTEAEHIYPHVAAGDSNYLTVWEKWVSPVAIHGCIISGNGVPVDTGFPIIEGENGIPIIPDVASCGENYLVIVTARDTLFGSLVSPAGDLLGDPFRIAVDPGRAWSSVIWADTVYLVIWEQDVGKGPTDVYGRWVSREGVPLDTCFVVSDAYHWQCEPAVASGNRDCLAVWSDTRSSDYDIYGQIIDVLPVEEKDERRETRDERIRVSPNPFVDACRIQYSVSAEGPVSVRIYDTTGRVVQTLINELNKPQGSYVVNWNGRGVPGGVYFVKLRAGDMTEVEKLVKMEVK